MKRSFLVIASLALVLCLTAGTASAATWKISHTRPKDSPIDKGLTAFGQELEKGTEGRVKLKLFPAASLGDYTVVQERISLGAVEMACQSLATASDKRFQLATMPFLVEDWKSAEANFRSGSALMDAFGELYLKQNIRLLACWPQYFGGIALNKEPSDPLVAGANKNCKLRIPPLKGMALLSAGLGYQAAPLPFAEAFTAVQTGVVDGVMGSGAEGYYASFRDVTKFYIPANTHFEAWMLIVNEDRFQKLSKDDQNALVAAARNFEDARWKVAASEQGEYEKKLESSGAKIIPVSDAVLADFAKVAREKVWPELMQDMGTEWVEGVLSKMAR